MWAACTEYTSARGARLWGRSKSLEYVTRRNEVNNDVQVKVNVAGVTAGCELVDRGNFVAHQKHVEVEGE